MHEAAEEAERGGKPDRVTTYRGRGAELAGGERVSEPEDER